MAPPRISVVIPTRNRRETLLANLSRLEPQAAVLEIEVVVIDDGSADGTADAVRELAGSAQVELRVISGTGGGPAAARNLGIDAARGEAIVFLDDDVWLRDGAVRRHALFHTEHRAKEDALLGRVVAAPALDSQLAKWAHENGALFAYAELRADQQLPSTRFWTAHSSVKTALLRDAGGFDEKLRFFEDVELASRLEAAGMRLRYDPDAVGEHAQRIDLAGLMARARASGPYFKLLAAKVPGTALPRAPGATHRVKAGVLTALWSAGVRPPAVKHAVWSFLVDEAQRESVWGVEGKLLIGSALERMVLGHR